MLNQLSIIGYVGKDAELRFTPKGKPVLNFSVAFTKVFKNKEGQKDERTTWYQCQIWGDRAEHLSPYIKKGSHLFVTGEPVANAYLNDKKEAVGTLGLNVHSVKFLDKRTSDDASDDAIINAEALAIAEEAEAELNSLVTVE